jgi:hypothetical protein
VENKSATLRLVELAEKLVPTGEIGDGMVAHFHDLAALARAELPPVRPVCDERGCTNWTGLINGRCYFHRVADLATERG